MLQEVQKSLLLKIVSHGDVDFFMRLNAQIISILPTASASLWEPFLKLRERFNADTVRLIVDGRLDKILQPRRRLDSSQVRPFFYSKTPRKRNESIYIMIVYCNLHPFQCTDEVIQSNTRGQV